MANEKWLRRERLTKVRSAELARILRLPAQVQLVPVEEFVLPIDFIDAALEDDALISLAWQNRPESIAIRGLTRGSLLSRAGREVATLDSSRAGGRDRRRLWWRCVDHISFGCRSQRRRLACRVGMAEFGNGQCRSAATTTR